MNDELAIKHTELAVLSFKIVYFQRTLNFADHHVSMKINCLAAELDSDNDEMKNENNSFNIQQLVNSMFSIF